MFDIQLGAYEFAAPTAPTLTPRALHPTKHKNACTSIACSASLARIVQRACISKAKGTFIIYGPGEGGGEPEGGGENFVTCSRRGGGGGGQLFFTILFGRGDFF